MNVFTMKGKNVESPVQVPEERVERFVLHCCGGGFNTKQTARAMAIMGQLRETGTATVNGITLTCTEE